VRVFVLEAANRQAVPDAHHGQPALYKGAQNGQGGRQEREKEQTGKWLGSAHGVGVVM